MFLNSVARYVILSIISVYHVEGNVIGCIMWKNITKIITTHWFNTEQLSIVVTLCNSAVVASVAHEIFQLRLFLPPPTLVNVKVEFE